MSRECGTKYCVYNVEGICDPDMERKIYMNECLYYTPLEPKMNGMNIKFEKKKISKNEAIDVFDGPDLLSEIHRMISGKVSENYDELVFSLLGQFGITKDNWRENLDRVTIVRDRLWVDHFHIDGEYRFSIVEEPGELIFDDEKGEYGVAVSYKVEVFKDML